MKKIFLSLIVLYFSHGILAYSAFAHEPQRSINGSWKGMLIADSHMTANSGCKWFYEINFVSKSQAMIRRTPVQYHGLIHSYCTSASWKSRVISNGNVYRLSLSPGVYWGVSFHYDAANTPFIINLNGASSAKDKKGVMVRYYYKGTLYKTN